MAQTALSIRDCFSLRKGEGRGVLIPYLTAGYPDVPTSLALMAALAEAGGDLLELGIPFSDPLADGPTIQRSSFRALEGGMTVAGSLELLRRFREAHPHPVVLFTYLNPVLRYGAEAFLEDAAEAGAQGILLTDLPSGADPGMGRQTAAQLADGTPVGTSTRAGAGCSTPTARIPCSPAERTAQHRGSCGVAVVRQKEELELEGARGVQPLGRQRGAEQRQGQDGPQQ